MSNKFSKFQKELRNRVKANLDYDKFTLTGDITQVSHALDFLNDLLQAHDTTLPFFTKKEQARLWLLNVREEPPRRRRPPQFSEFSLAHAARTLPSHQTMLPNANTHLPLLFVTADR